MATGSNSRDPFLKLSTQDQMEEAAYTDDIGRNFVVFVKPGTDPAKGVIKGPQPLDNLGLDQDTMVRLHNELHARGLITHRDAMRRPQEVLAAIQQALKVNVQRVQNAYLGILEAPEQPMSVQDKPVAKQHTTPTPQKTQGKPEDKPYEPTTVFGTEEGVTDAR